MPRIVSVPPVPTNSALGTSARAWVSLGTTATARRAGAETLSTTPENPSLIFRLPKKMRRPAG